MNFHALGQQFVRDMHASWPRTALLGILLLVGCWFWIPPVYHWLSGSGSSTTAAVAASSPAAGFPKSPPATAEQNPSASRVVEATWRRIEHTSQTDPLVRSAEVAALESSPFLIDPDQFPPPILFADEPEPPPALETLPEPQVADVQPAASDSLVLKSTIVGVRRRAAYINRRLYFVGSEIRSGGTTWRLKAVEPRRVILQQGNEQFELRIGGQTDERQEPL